MAIARRHSAQSSSGWLLAVLFNVMLVLTPVLAANVVAGVFSVREFPGDPTIESIVETRAQIDQSFSQMAPRDADSRTYWSDLVDRELHQRDMTAARGFLLAAVLMFDERDRKALESAMAENEKNPAYKTADERAVAASLLFLPNDVRARYETLTRPPALLSATPIVPDRQADPGAPTTASTEGGEATQQVPAEGDTKTLVIAPETSSAPAAFSILGSLSDLTRNSREWLASESMGNGLRDDGFELRLTGLGLIGDRVIESPDVNIADAMSVLRAAHRAGGLSPEYRARLDSALDETLPPATLRTRLADAFNEVVPTDERSVRVALAFETTLRPQAARPLVEEARLLNQLTRSVGPVATVSLVQHVGSTADIRRLRLVAEAGGPQAVALEKQIGGAILDHARTGIKLSRQDILEIMGLAAAAMAIFWMALAALQRLLKRPGRPVGYL